LDHQELLAWFSNIAIWWHNRDILPPKKTFNLIVFLAQRSICAGDKIYFLSRAKSNDSSDSIKKIIRPGAFAQSVYVTIEESDNCNWCKTLCVKVRLANMVPNRMLTLFFRFKIIFMELYWSNFIAECCLINVKGARSRSRTRMRSRNNLKVLASNIQNRRRGRMKVVVWNTLLSLCIWGGIFQKKSHRKWLSLSLAAFMKTKFSLVGPST